MVQDSLDGEKRMYPWTTSPSDLITTPAMKFMGMDFNVHPFLFHLLFLFLATPRRSHDASPQLADRCILLKL